MRGHNWRGQQPLSQTISAVMPIHKQTSSAASSSPHPTTPLPSPRRPEPRPPTARKSLVVGPTDNLGRVYHLLTGGELNTQRLNLLTQGIGPGTLGVPRLLRPFPVTLGPLSPGPGLRCCL